MCDISAANVRAAAESNPIGGAAETIGRSPLGMGSEAEARRRAKRLALVWMAASSVAALAILGLAWWAIWALT